MADELEYVKIGIAALTPIVTGIVGALVLRMGARIEHGKTLHRELLKKRLDLFEDIAPKLNDLYCFFQAIGHWSDLNPHEIISRKRAIDRALHINRFLFDQDVWEAYREFEDLHFEMYSEVGRPAKLRLDMDWMKERLGESFKSEWTPSVSAKAGERQAQKAAYETLMNALGRSIVVSA
jgi:regulator of replication initiation timing